MTDIYGMSAFRRRYVRASPALADDMTISQFSKRDVRGSILRRGPHHQVLFPVGLLSPNYDGVLSAGGSARIRNAWSVAYTFHGNIGVWRL